MRMNALYCCILRGRVSLCLQRVFCGMCRAPTHACPNTVTHVSALLLSLARVRTMVESDGVNRSMCTEFFVLVCIFGQRTLKLITLILRRLRRIVSAPDAFYTSSNQDNLAAV